MKTINRLLIATLFLIALPATFAHAQFFNNYAEFYTVGSNGSTTAQTTFQVNQNPYLYVEISNPAVPLNVDLTFTDQTNGANTFSTATFSNQNQLWINLDQILTKPGTWTIYGVTDTPNNGNIEGYQGLATVNVAPEPMGMILFLLGGAIMAIYLVRRKKALTV